MSRDEEDTTTIQVSVENWQRLSGMKLPGESFDDAVSRALAAADRVDELEAEVERLREQSED